MAPLVGIIINLNAMLIRKKGLKYIKKIKKIAAQYENVKVFITQNSNEVHQIIQELKNQNVAYICCCGGDGALRNIIQEVIEIYQSENLPIIAHIGGGSMSMIAKALGFKKEPHQNLITVLNLRLKKIQPIYQKELIQINSPDKTYYGLFFSIGVIVDYLKYYEQTSKGFWAAIALILRCILGTIFKKLRIYHYAQANVNYDDQLFPKNRFAGIIAANIKDVVLTFRPLSGIIQKNSFLLGIFALNAFEVISHVFKYLWGKPVARDLKAGKVFNGNAQTLAIETNEDFTIDGDLFFNNESATRTIKITIGPNIKLLNLNLVQTGI